MSPQRKSSQKAKRRANWLLISGLALTFTAGVALGIYLAWKRECLCDVKVATQATCNWPEGIGIIS